MEVVEGTILDSDTKLENKQFTAKEGDDGLMSDENSNQDEEGKENFNN